MIDNSEMMINIRDLEIGMKQIVMTEVGIINPIIQETDLDKMTMIVDLEILTIIEEMIDIIGERTVTFILNFSLFFKSILEIYHYEEGT